MSDLKWEEPPSAPNSGPNRKWAPVVEQLRANPGRWAFVAEGGGMSIVQTLKRYDGVEVTTRGQKNGKADIYARFVAGVSGE